MTDIDRHYINGAWVASHGRETMPILNPATNSRIGSLTLANGADVDCAVKAAQTAFETWGFTPKSERRRLLTRLLAISEAREEQVAQAITAEMGAPITLSREQQAASGAGHIRAFLDAFDALDEEETLPNGDILSREPIGVCGLITPWNWPVNQIALKVVPALAAGNTCVLKPSEHTPLSARLYAEMIHEAGFPAGVFNLVFGDGPGVGAALSRHADVEMMSFTGSTRAGISVTKDAAETVKRVALELGGKSPNIIFADADLDARVPEGVFECFSNSGQSCNAPTRMLVERSVYARAVELAAEAARAQAVGDPLVEGEHIGPLFDEIQYHRVQTLISKGIDEGARLVVGGLGKPDGFEAGWYVKPTLFADVRNDMTIAQQEIFGPVLVMIPFDSEEAAIAIANDTPYGLDAYLATSDPARAARVARRLRAGSIHINGRAPDYGSPFGGFKQSGNGREGGVHGLAEFYEVKVRPPFQL